MKIIYGLLFVMFAFASEKTEVVLKSKLETGNQIKLQLEDLILKPNPAPQELLDISVPLESGSVQKTELLEWFKKTRADRRELNLYTFSVPEKIQIDKLDANPAEIFISRMNNRLKVKCSECEHKIKLTHFPKGQEKIDRLDFAQLPGSGPFMISTLDSEGKKSGWITGQIQTSREIVKSTRFIQSGERLRDEDLTLEKTDISFNKDYFTDKKAIIGKKVSKPMAIKSVISSQDIERSYDIKQGEVVRAKAGSSGFEVTIQAIALDSGSIGDRIRSQNYQKLLSARVLESGLVEIQ
jgi:flagella basal body P-ring formation protein FlgA